MKDTIVPRAPVYTPPPLNALDVPSRPSTIAELCEWLGVSRRYIEGQVATGKLRVRKISSRLVRVMPSDVARWLDQAATKEGEV